MTSHPSQVTTTTFFSGLSLFASSPDATQAPIVAKALSSKRVFGDLLM